MNPKVNVIVVPIYKSNLNEFEIISLRQLVKVLYKHEIRFITYKELNTTAYDKELQSATIKYAYEYFEASYFENTAGYNRLMLSLDFYKRFNAFEYMLIYQLDAYVFRDELEAWCAKGYDFVGAPLIEDKYGVENKFFLNHYNGGFSLRSIKYSIRLLSYKGPLLKPNLIYRIVKEEFKSNPLKGMIYFVLRSVGRQNNVSFLKRKTPINEDLFFTLGLFVSWMNCNVTKNEAWIYPKLPAIDETIQFAFERFPIYLFGLNNNKLPFGCHAWEKYEYDEFWKIHIIK